MAFKLTYWSITLLSIFSLALGLEHRAYAYTDPGSCLLLFQSLGAVASGALFYFRRNLRRIFTRTGSKKPLATQAVASRGES